MTQQSRELIFWDTEFSSLDPYRGEILSVGMVRQSGQELYLELEYDGLCDPWVQEHLLPMLHGPRVSREQACERVREFVGTGKPRAVAYVNQFDTLYLHKLMGGVDHNPFYWIPVDFAAVLFAAGIEPERYYNQDATLFAEWGVDVSRYVQHNALDDARLLRESYLALEAWQHDRAGERRG